MAKSRSRSGSKSRSKSKAKTSRKTTRKRRPKPAADRIELRGIRRLAEQHVKLIEGHPAPGEKAMAVRDRMRQWLADIGESCGADMTIPLA